ncbi:XRE family transcriptional regulator [Polymorphospora sp. NPDC050346]|uniref:XRE family transcriptional regulator n=1 Tax=Polymorphospora sp. NPDC050346 TaxID=3155780 RepID=UPI0033E74EE1
MDSRRTSRRPAVDGGGEGAEVGRRVRELREARGVSLSALSRRAGVGKATLSGLENGTRNPTLETLYAVTAELGVPLAAVLAAPGTDAATIRGTAVEATLLQVFDEGDVTFELYRMRVPPGPPQTSPAHQRGVAEHVTVFSGLLRAGPVGAPALAGTGQHITWISDVPHVYGAVGDDEVHASLLIRYPGRSRRP